MFCIIYRNSDEVKMVLWLFLTVINSEIDGFRLERKLVNLSLQSQNAFSVYAPTLKLFQNSKLRKSGFD